LIIIIKSSLKVSGVSGIAQTLISNGTSLTFNKELSGSTKNMFFLYYELLDNAVLINENSSYASNLPLLEILNVVELIFLTLVSSLSATFLPMSMGPKSKIFSL